MATNSMLSPELLARINAYYASPEATTAGYTDPITNQGFLRAENPLLQGYSFMQHMPGGAGTLDPQFDANGNFIANRPRPTEGFMDKMISSSLPAFAMLAAPFVLPALGFGAAGAAAGAGELAGVAGTDLLAGGAGADALGAGAFSGSGALTGGLGGLEAGTGYGLATLPELGIGGATYGAGAGGLEAALAGLGAAGAGGAALAAGAGGGGAPLPAHDFTHSGVGSGLADGIAGAGGGFDWTRLIGPALSAVGGIAGANAASSAADAQLQAAREAQALAEPFRQGGLAGMNSLLSGLGLAGSPGAAGYGALSKPFTGADLASEPGYQFRLSEGEKAATRAAAAQGGFGSGRYLKDLTTYGQGQAAQEYGNAFNRYQVNRTNTINPLLSLMGAGQTAANTIGEYGTQGANATAAGKVGQANALGNALTQGYSMYQNQGLQDQNRLFQNALMNRWASTPASWAMGG
jgi:hypothetical protein